MSNMCGECYWFEKDYCPASSKVEYDSEACIMFYDPKMDHIKKASPGF